MLKRVISAIVLGGLTVVLVVIPHTLFFELVILFIIAMALYELFRLVFKEDLSSRLLGVFLGLVVSGSIILQLSKEYTLGIAVLMLFVVFMYHMHKSDELVGLAEKVGMTVFGAIYIAIPLTYFILLREQTHGVALVFLALVPTWCSDSAALLIGKKFGKRKFSKYSPNKTWEGFVAGIVGSFLGVILIKSMLWPELDLINCIVLGSLISVTASLGDLAESAIKRSYGVKDSGTLIPGHGGILDRVDALIFTAPLVYYYFKVIGI
ncbi:phosphatidate cytidylyltransferase [bacterium]|nr:phosphatidate cytidylyltransferase [bacterium]